VSLCNTAFGFDIGVVSGSLADLSSSLNLSRIEEEAATSGLNFFSGIGAIFVSATLLDWIGRRRTLLAAAVLLAAGSAMVASAPSFVFLLLGRALQGLGSGCSIVASSVFITELAPTKFRGALVAVADVAINFGILLGYVADYAVKRSTEGHPSAHWRTSMALTTVMPLCYCLAYPFIPESPRWLAAQGGRRDREALAVLERGYTAGDHPPALALERIKRAIAAESPPCWRRLLCPPAGARMQIVLALALGLAQQLTGTEAILYYAPTILKNLSEQWQFVANLGIGCSKFVGELVAALIVERVGRKAPIVGGNLVLALAVFGLAMSLDGSDVGGSNHSNHSNHSKAPAAAAATPASALSIGLLCLMMFAFSLGPGPFTWVVVNEMTPYAARSRTVAASVLVNRLASGTVALTFLSLEHTLGVTHTFFMYGGIGLAVTLFYAMVVKDSTGIVLEQASSL
jgi:sugar porter (SP) family MFS transporter